MRLQKERQCKRCHTDYGAICFLRGHELEEEDE